MSKPPANPQAIKGMQYPTYRTWWHMLSRCYDPRNPSYPRYGARGIAVCERWRDFYNFVADMGHRPVGMTLDRINGEIGYQSGNCRWATPKQQQRNMRSNCLLTFLGETLPAAAWAEKYGITRNALWKRLKRGWSLEEALTTSTQARRT